MAMITRTSRTILLDEEGGGGSAITIAPADAGDGIDIRQDNDRIFMSIEQASAVCSALAAAIAEFS